MASRKHRKTARRSRRVRRGGVGTTVDYGSAAGYGLATYGPGNVQYQNVFGPGPMYPEGNELVSLTGQKAGSRKKHGGIWGEVISQAAVPVALLGMQQSFGKKHHKKGGFLGQAISQAAVPVALLGMQQTFGRRRHTSNKTRKHHKR